MNLSFKSEHIVAQLQGTTAMQVIDELVGHLVAVGAIPLAASESVTLALKHREHSMSTGIGFGVAIPHAASDLIKEPIVAFGRSTGGIQFDALDHQPVQLVVMMIVPVADRQKHLPILAGVSRLLHNREVRTALQNAADTAAIMQILNERCAATPALNAA